MRTNCILAAFLVQAASFGLGDEVEVRQELNEQYKARLNASIERERSARQQFMLMTVDNLDRVCNLKDAQLKKLQLAAKGAVDQSVDRFRQQMTDMLVEQQKMIEQRRLGNRLVALKRPTVQYGGATVLDEKLWKATIDRTLDDQQKKLWHDEVRKSAEIERQLMIDLAVSMIGTQVRLASSQRGPLAKIVEKHLPDASNASSNLNVYSRVSRDLMPKLAIVSEERLSEILSAAQLDAWNTYFARYKARPAAAGARLQAVPAQRLLPARAAPVKRK